MLPDYVDYSPIRYYIYYNDLMRAQIDAASIFLRGSVYMYIYIYIDR